jgi:hypothetical protein
MQKSNSQLALDAMTRAALESARIALDAISRMADVAAAASPLQAFGTASCCEIPPACWLPRSFGCFESRACPGGTALLRVKVCNCQPRASDIAIRVESDADVVFKVTPERATIAPMACKRFTVTVSIPEDACKGHSYDFRVWVDGCHHHYARWSVTAGHDASGTCNEAEVEDCPDYVHHWYDHFYCQHPCTARPPNAAGRTT